MMKKIIGLMGLLVALAAAAQNLEIQDNGDTAGTATTRPGRSARLAAVTGGTPSVKLYPVSGFAPDDSRYTTNMAAVLELLKVGTLPPSAVLTYVSPSNFITTKVVPPPDGVDGKGRVVHFWFVATATSGGSVTADAISGQATSVNHDFDKSTSFVGRAYTDLLVGKRAGQWDLKSGNASIAAEAIIGAISLTSYNVRSTADVASVLPHLNRTSPWSTTMTVMVGDAKDTVTLGLVPPAIPLPKLFTSRLAGGSVRISAETNGNLGTFKLQSVKVLGGSFSSIADMQAGQSVDIPAIAVTANSFYRLRRP